MSSSRPWVPCFFPPLGISVLVSSKSDVKVYNAQTGVLEKEACLLTGSNVKDICMCVGYFTNERLVIAGGTEINARRHLNESILLQGFLNRRIQHKSDEISLELDSQQSSVLELFLFKNDYSLTDFEELTFETLNGRSPKWKTFTITGSYEHIYYLVNHLLHMCSHENHSVDPLYRSMLHRLIRIALDSDSILFYTAKREPLTMQCEAHRRLTFAHWPHMDYQWATPSALAEAGFYFPFKYPLDIVYCFECLINLASWEPTDEPWSEHIRHSSSCSFVSSPNLKSIPSVVSWATETAQTQTISNEPITVLTTTSSKDFIATSTVNGGITIWDLSYFNRRTLEFNLVDVLNASILDVSKRVNKSQLEVHCGCLLVSNAAYLPELICLPKPPKLHHLILACCLPNSVYNELKCTLNKNSSTTTTAATAVNSFGSHKLCLLILQLTPLNSEQLMWLSDTLSAPTSVKSFVYSSTISGANIFSLHSVPVNLMKFLPLIGTVGHTVEDDEEEDDDEEEEEAEEGGDDYDGVNGDGDDDDYDDELAEIDSNETESQNANLLVDDVTLSPPISSGEATMTQSPSTSQVDLNQPVEDGLYKYLALSNVIDESVSFKVMDCQKITSNDNNDASKLKSSSKPFFSSPSQSPSPSSPIKQQSNPTEATTITTTTDDILSDCHSKRITDKLPTLIGIIHLSDINNPTDTDVQKLNLKVLKISPVVGLPTSMNHANRSTTSSPQGILVCCGTELSSLSGDDDDDIHHNDTAENQHQSTENGDLFLFEYKAGAVDWNASHSVLSENPLLHIQLPGNYCPIEMDVLSNDNNDLQYCCCSNPLNNIIQLPIEYYSVKQDNQIKRDAKFTLQSFIDCTSGDLSMCCFLLTISGSLLQVNFYNDFSCLIQLLISDPISCIDEDIQQKNEKTDEETTSVNVHRIQFNAFTYCTGLGNLCLCTVDGQMCIYQLYNQELFKYDMNKEKRITLKSSASSVNIKKSKTSSSIIDNTSITSCSLSDLYAYCNSPIDQCIILHQLIQTIPVDAQIQINFPDRIGWYEVDLFRSIISPSPSDGRINNTRFEKKDMLTDDQDPKISSSSNDNETIHILSRLVTRYLQLEGCDSSNKSKLTTSTTNNLPVALKCASLAVQLSLSGGLSARLWEFNIKNWVAYQALMKHPSPERSANTMTDEQTTLPCKINSTAYSKMNTSSEYVLDISLPRVCSLSHFVFHSTMKPYEKTKSRQKCI
uniref:UBIQUITIN_CONJUGAT_2 domain-containing protein n=1 Tax=Trichobilharzia regenti TaxID=157069 RepID=A0AA85JIP4_TRIRE|nr:unnamed protein product [Trichobilharzia regenti]